MLTTFTVNDLGDTGVFDFEDNIVTLREAVFRANQLDDHDTIVFDQSLNGQTIFLNDNSGRRGLEITESVTIDASMLTSGLTITGNTGGAGIYIFYAGKQVFETTVTIDDVVVENNPGSGLRLAA